MPDPVMSAVVAALVTGATAQLSSIATQAVADAYTGLKTLIIAKLGGKAGIVQAVEEDPQAKQTQEYLTEKLEELNEEEHKPLYEAADNLAAEIEKINGSNNEIAEMREKLQSAISVSAGRDAYIKNTISGSPNSQIGPNVSNGNKEHS